jgi:hypothetical protein
VKASPFRVKLLEGFSGSNKVLSDVTQSLGPSCLGPNFDLLLLLSYRSHGIRG